MNVNNELDTESEFWGSALIPWPASAAECLRVSPKDMLYLTDIGFPTDVDWNLSILIPLSGHPKSYEPGLVVLAYDGPVPICVDERQGGVVVAVENRGSSPRLVNANIRRFGAFLMLYQQYRTTVRNLDDEAAGHVVDQVQRRMEKADPSAMRDPESYWPLVVEQMRDGFI